MKPGCPGTKNITFCATKATVDWSRPDLISQKVFIKSFCKSQFPHKSVNLFFISVMIKDKLTDLCGNLIKTTL